MILFIPSLVGLMVLSRPIISFVYMRGAFGYDDMVRTADVLFYYTIYLIGPAVADLLYLSFFSVQNTKIPTIISFIQLCVNVFLDYALSGKYGLVGLALATTLSQFVLVGLAIIMYRKYFGKLNHAYIIKNIGKIAIGGLALGFVTNYTYKLRPSNSWLLVTILCGAIVYLAIIFALKVDGADELKEKFLKKIKR